MLGNGRLEAMCFDGEKRLAHIRGKMRKKVGAPELALQSSSSATADEIYASTRSGSTKEISSSYHFETSKMTRRT